MARQKRHVSQRLWHRGTLEQLQWSARNGKLAENLHNYQGDSSDGCFDVTIFGKCTKNSTFVGVKAWFIFTPLSRRGEQREGVKQ